MTNNNLKSNSRPSPSWQWWLAGVIALVAFVFSVFGLWQYDIQHGNQPDIVSVVYHTLQLFILNASHTEDPIPWPLQLGRILAAILFFAATGKALLNVFWNEIQLLRLRFAVGHVIICGLGDLGLRLALDGRRRRRFIVAIDKNPAPGTLERARESGVLVLKGDARDISMLHKVRIEKAEFLVAVCQRDRDNVAIAAFAGQCMQPGKRRNDPLICRLLIQDHKLRSMLNNGKMFPNTGENYQINFNDIDLEDTSARQAFRKYPMDFIDSESINENDDTTVHLVVIGFEQVGQAMVLQAAQIGHFANEVGMHQKRLRITVVDKEPSAWNNFISQYPNLPKVCDTHLEVMNFDEDGFVYAMAALCPETQTQKTKVTYAICLENDQKNLDQKNFELGLELSKKTENYTAQVLIYQTSRKGFSAMFPVDGRGSDLNDRIHVYGMQEDVFSWDVLLHKSEDKLASALHNAYRDKQTVRGVLVKDNPDWDKLSEALKESNRQAADHFEVKMRALGYQYGPLTTKKKRIEFKDLNDNLELLSKMEHTRWCAERWLDGWVLGPLRDRGNKISDCLIPWDNLPKDKQILDRE